MKKSQIPNCNAIKQVDVRPTLHGVLEGKRRLFREFDPVAWAPRTLVFLPEWEICGSIYRARGKAVCLEVCRETSPDLRFCIHALKWDGLIRLQLFNEPLSRDSHGGVRECPRGLLVISTSGVFEPAEPLELDD